MKHFQSDEDYDWWSDWDTPPIGAPFHDDDGFYMPSDEIVPKPNFTKLPPPLGNGQPFIEVPYYSTMWIGTKDEYEKCKDSIGDHTLIIITNDV